MNTADKVYCPSSQDFLYWAPESIADYDHWCEIEQNDIVQTKPLIEADKILPQKNLND